MGPIHIRTYKNARTEITPLQGGPTKVRPTYIFDSNIWIYS